MARFRAWRFWHPDFDAERVASGLVLSPTAAVAMVDADASVRQALLLLLSTRRGERVMRPDYGCELDRLAFSPCDATTAGMAVHYVRRAIRRFEPRVEIISLDAQSDPLRPACLNIELHYRVRPTRNEASLRYQVEIHSGDGT